MRINALEPTAHLEESMNALRLSASVRQRINDEASGLRNTEVPADLLGEEIGDFGVARHRFNSAIRRVGPE